MFNKVVSFMQGLTKEEVYGNTVKSTKEEIIINKDKEDLFKSLEEMVEEVDKDFEYRLNKMRLVMDNEVQLTPFVKGGKL